MGSPPTNAPKWGRWFTIGWYRIKAGVRSWDWWGRQGLYLLSLVMLGIPAYKQSVGWGIAHTAASVALVMGKARVFSTDRTMKLVRAKYLERKAMLYRLIKDLQRHPDMSKAELLRFQQETLSLIASFARSHRDDLSANKIYVNLLVEDGADIVVIARDQDHRKPVARYDRRLMAAARAFDGGDHVFVSNVHREYGDTEKAYRSILLLPVRGPSSVLAVVSIDSTRPYHFDLEASDLEQYLQPYLALLEWSLLRCEPEGREK